MIAKNVGIVKEPIRGIYQQIENMNKKIVVLTGNRGSGRSTVLQSKTNENGKGKDFHIYHFFEHCGIGVTTDEVGISFIEHRFELYMASVLLNCLKKQGIFTEQDKKISEEVKKAFASFHNDASKIRCGKHINTTIATPGYYTEDLVQEIKELFQVENLYFLGDRFDWMFNFNPLAQKCISAYFPLFDKVVLTTDDKNYNASYPTIEVNYGTNKEVVKRILKYYVYLENKRRAQKGDYLPLDRNLGEETLDFIIEKANGDIQSIILSVNSLYSALGYLSDEELNEIGNAKISELWKEFLEEKLDYRKEVEAVPRLARLSPKFHI